MARVKVEALVEYLKREFRGALRDAVSEEFPNADIDEHALFRAFKRSVGRKCSGWRTVPDHLIEMDR